MNERDLWTLKVKAFLRCPPYRAFISDSEERECAEELISSLLDDGRYPRRS